MEEKKKRFLLLTPFYQSVPAISAKSFMDTIYQGSKEYDFNYLIHCGSYITIARNTLFMEAIEKHKANPFDYILIVDADQIWRWDQITQMIRHYDEWGLDMLGADIFIRNDQMGQGMAQHMMYNLKPDGHIDWVVPGEYEFTPCDGAGFGFLLMSGNKLQEIAEKFDGTLLAEASIYSKFGVRPIEYRGEDVHFFKKCKELGFTFAIDNTVHVGHHGFSK